MKKFTITKRNGKKRLIFAPNAAEKQALRCMVPPLTEVAQVVCDPDIVHGFMPGRSPITNAQRHIGYQFTLSMDLADFFDTVTRAMIPSPEEICAIWSEATVFHVGTLLAQVSTGCFPEGAARQGLPTSPILANIAAAKMDAEIKKMITPFGIVYTRYADDLTFSGNRKDDILEVRWRVGAIASRHGFSVNQRKTRIQWAGFGRRVITGVAVDDHALYPTRDVRRRLRAVLHQKRGNVAAGLQEWMKLKPPNPNGPRKLSRVQRAVTRHIASKLNQPKKA